MLKIEGAGTARLTNDEPKGILSSMTYRDHTIYFLLNITQNLGQELARYGLISLELKFWQRCSEYARCTGDANTVSSISRGEEERKLAYTKIETAQLASIWGSAPLE